MRRLLVPLLLLAFLAPAAAQVHEPSLEAYSFRAVLGDDPRTASTENPALLHVNETFPVTNDGDETLTRIEAYVPRGAAVEAFGPAFGEADGNVTGNADPDESGAFWVYEFPPGEGIGPGETLTGVTLRYALNAADLGGLRVTKKELPPGASSYVVRVIVPASVEVRSDRALRPVPLDVYAGYVVYELSEAQPAESLRLTFAPAEVAAPGGGGDGTVNWIVAAMALVGGLVIGLGLARVRRRAPSARPGGLPASVPELEARRRVLMAALKELELAHRAGEVPDAAYSPLKGELKAQTVQVLTELEKRGAAAGA